MRGLINETACSCLNNRRICQMDPAISFQLAHLITDGLNVSDAFQEKFFYKINQANKELGRQVKINENS